MEGFKLLLSVIQSAAQIIIAAHSALHVNSILLQGRRIFYTASRRYCLFRYLGSGLCSSLIFFSILKVSSFVISLLFRVCEETNRIGGHVVGR